MTREEAIAELSVLHERLSNPKDCEDGCYSWEDGWYVEAIDMAIEALHKSIQMSNIQQLEAENGALKEMIKFYRNELDGAESVVQCKDCIHQDHCHETVAHTRHHDDFIEYWSETIEWCSRGERREP
jgi:hypothetical protein